METIMSKQTSAQATKIEDKNTTTEAPKTQKESVNEIAKAGYVLEDLYKEHKTTSGVIRFLASKGYKNGPISKFLNKRYQHVRNVLNQKLKSDDQK